MKMICTSREEADELCQKIDAHLGYPRMEQGEIGPPVWTERWTVPIEMADGKFGVIVDDRIEEELGKGIATAKRARAVWMHEIKIQVDTMNESVAIPEEKLVDAVPVVEEVISFDDV